MISKRLASVLVASTFALGAIACDGGGAGDGIYYPAYNGGSGTSGGTGTSGGAASSADEHPAWLVGPSWTKGYKTENNVAFESEDVGIKLGGSPGYEVEEKTGTSWSKSGTWKVSSGSILLSAGGSIAISSMKANCRILSHEGKTLFTSEPVEGCPSAKPLSATECAKAGYYSKSSESGSSSSSYGTSTTYVLDPDGVITYTTGSFSSTCYSTTCKSLSSTSAPQVGRWWLSGSTVTSDLAQGVNLTGFDFTETTEECGGVKKAPGGAD